MSGIAYPSEYPYLVSVIIPIYNVENYICSSLKSALNQTYPEIEYILVDDCGTDSSMSIVESIINHPDYSNKRVKVIKHSSNRGLSAARNTGLKHAVGEYVFFMDSDDEISGNCIEKHVISMSDSNADFSIANIKLVGAKSVHIKDLCEDIVDSSPLQSFLKRRWSVSAWNKLYRRDFIQNNNLQFDDGLIHEDIIWSYRVAKEAKKIAFVHDRTYKYKINKNSITRKPNVDKKIDSLLFILHQIATDRRVNSFNSEYNEFISYWIFNTTLLLLNFDGDLKSKRQYYSKLQMLAEQCGLNIYNCVLLLPYNLYVIIMKPLYKIYKRII